MTDAEGLLAVKHQTSPLETMRAVVCTVGVLAALAIVACCASVPQALAFGQVTRSPFVTGPGGGLLEAANRATGNVSVPSTTDGPPSASVKAISTRSSMPRLAASSSAPCVFVGSVTDCQSDDPVVTLEYTNNGDTSSCTFSDSINWGDGSPVQNVTFPGGDNSTAVVATHSYLIEGVYTITDTPAVLSGGCTISGVVNDQFTLLAVPPPVLGKSVDVAPVSGVVLLKQPGNSGFIRLQAGGRVPVGSTIDTTAGVMSLTAAPAKSGTAQSGTFGGAFFKMQQSAGGPAPGQATLSLLESAVDGVPSYSSKCRKATHSAKVVQMLAAHVTHGKFRIRGRYSTATDSTARGQKASWVTVDRCDGTLTRVESGTVSVHDGHLHKTVVLHADSQYLAGP